ncbi:MAG: hypothetical protein IH955_04635 [Chloroflexi bacterium]|nr:hypothetical protein [Chloroflexota bacterium]
MVVVKIIVALLVVFAVGIFIAVLGEIGDSGGMFFLGLSIVFLTPVIASVIIIFLLFFRIIEPSSESKPSAEYLFDQARTYWNKKEMDSCLWNLRKAVELDPLYREKATYTKMKLGLAEHFYNRACMRSVEGNEPGGVRDLAKAIELNPSCREKAKQDKALEWARQDPRVRRLLGMSEM